MARAAKSRMNWLCVQRAIRCLRSMVKQPRKNLDVWRIFTYRITLVSYFYDFTDRNYKRNISNIRIWKHQVRNFSINLINNKRKGKMDPFGVVFQQPKASNAHAATSFEISQFLPSACKQLPLSKLPSGYLNS